MSEYKFRQGASSEILRMEIQKQLLGKFPGVAVSVEKDAKGPPAGYPITIEIMGEDYIELIGVAKNMKELLNKINIAGVEELKIDVNKNKPGVQLNLDRKKAGELGVNASQVGQQLRTSLFGTKAGVF
jgi:multidrug efflux pump subunit AcrB